MANHSLTRREALAGLAALVAGCGLKVKTSLRSDMHQEEPAPEEPVKPMPQIKLYQPELGVLLPGGAKLREPSGGSRDYTGKQGSICYGDWCRTGDTLSDYLRTRAQGRAVLLNFMAYWCGPCKKEIPQLNELAKRYENILTVVGLHVYYEHGGDGADLDDVVKKAPKMIEEEGIEFPVKLISVRDVETIFGAVPGDMAKKLPVNVLVDRGRFIRYSTGMLRTREQSRSYLLEERDTIEETCIAIEMVSREGQ
ncbi:TlpA family protein disulfide reductase [Candidatus Woesearchaeota archaeon]|nr:TlpA family protein disulfide reductase [Candidatus Woesearchaeota archaeon]